MADIVLIAAPTFDWDTFLRIVPEVLEYSPTDLADNSNRNLTEHAKILLALESFRNPKHKDAVVALRNSRPAQSALIYAYLVGCASSVLIELHELNTGLSVNTPQQMMKAQNTLAVVSGSLDRWVQSIIIGCRPEVSQELRLLFDKVYVSFAQLGLGELWSNYNRVDCRDKTFLLEFKR